MFFRPVRKMRNIFASLRGGEHPAEIAAGVCLGLFLGLTPFGLHLLIPVLVMLIFRCSTGLAFFSMGISKGFYLLLAGPFYHTGFYLLNETQIFDGLIATLMQTPVIAFMGFNQYLLFGSYVICTAAAIVLFPLVYILVKLFRNQFIEWIKQPGWMQSFIQSTIGSWIIWLCFGNPGDDEEEEEKEEEKSGGIGAYFGFLRLKMIGGLVGVVLVVFVISFLGYGLGFTSMTSSALSSASGVDVQVESASLSPTGRVSIKGIAGADPSSEGQDLFKADEVVLDVNMYRVLAGKLHVSELSLNTLRLNVRRKEDGSLNIEDVAEPEEKKTEQTAEGEQTYTEWVKEKGREADWIELIKKYGKSFMEEEPSEEETAAEKEKPERKPTKPGVEYRDGKRVVVFDPDAAYQFEDRIPTVRVRKIALNDVEVGLSEQTASDNKQDLPDLEKINGNIQNLSSSPALLDQPVTTKLSGQFDGKKNETIAIDGSYKPDKKTSLNAAMSQLNLIRLRPIYENTIPVRVEKGNLSTTFTSKIMNGQIDAPTDLSLAGLKLKKKSENQKLFGLKPDTSDYILQGLNAYAEEQPIAFAFNVDGPVDNPQFHWKAQFLSVAKKGLKSLGKQVAQKHLDRINGELGEAKEKLEKEAKNQLKNITEGALKSAQSGDSDDTKKNVEDAKESVKDSVEDLNPFD